MFLWLRQVDECREYFRVNVKILTLNGLVVSVVSLRLLLLGRKATFLVNFRMLQRRFIL